MRFKEHRCPNCGVHIGAVEIKVVSHQDPNRIARNVFEMLAARGHRASWWRRPLRAIGRLFYRLAA